LDFKINLVRKIDFLRQNQSGSCVSVTYTTIEEARSAFKELNGFIEQGREIIVNSSCLKTEVTAGKQNCRLKAIWYLTHSTGNGRIIFSQEKNALDAYQLFKRLYYQCHYERSTNFPTLKIIYYLGENRGTAFINFESLEHAQNAVIRMNDVPRITLARDKFNRAGSVLFQNVPKDFDEEDVRNYFQGCSGLVNVQVLRGRRGQRFQKPDSTEDDIKSIFDQYTSFQPDTITINSNIINGKLEAYVEFLNITDLKQAIDDIDGETGLIGCGKVRLSERIQQKKDNSKKKKENEYIIKFQHLDRSCDKYDLIKILKEHQLYDNVKNVTIFRQKLEDITSTMMETSASVEQDIGLIRLRSMFLDGKDLFHSVPDCQISSSTPDGTVTALVLFKDPVDVITAIQTYDNQEIELLLRTTKLRLIPSISHEIFINAALTKAISEKIQQTIQHIREHFKRVYIKAIPSNKTEKAATMKIFINGDDIQQITMAKIEFDNLMKGMEYKFENDLEKVTRIVISKKECYVILLDKNSF
jgi:RNA recognition motif-containing protein